MEDYNFETNDGKHSNFLRNNVQNCLRNKDSEFEKTDS